MTYNHNKYRFQSIHQTSPNKATMKKYYIYIISSTSGTLYTGATSDIEHRVYQHKHKLMDGFAKKYNVDRLAYYEETTDINIAIAQEKEIKGWRRSKKISLIKSINPKWKDLAEDWFEEDSD
jgi:putative endonuclease